MHHPKILRLVALCALTLACRNAAPEPSAPLATPALPRSAHPTSPHELPAGHPPMQGHPSTLPNTPPAAARELHWSDPVGWRRVQPSSTMRRAQYVIPGASSTDDAELTVFYFGAGQGGSVEENVRRWHGQFVTEGAAPAAPPPTQDRTVHGLRVHLTERFGRFGGMAMPNAPAPAVRDNWGMLGAIVETEQGPWFFKMTGPRATVEAARGRFDDLVASFQVP